MKIQGGVVMKKLKSKIKYHSAIIFPILSVILLSVIDNKYGLLSKVPEKKMDALIGIIISIVGIFLTVLTIYLSFPKNDIVKQRMKKTGHNHILLSNICIGIILLSVALLVWLFTNCYSIVICLFCAGLVNMLITGYYILVLSDFS